METVTRAEKKEMNELCKKLNTIASLTGFGKGLKSYDKLYKTSINTFSHPTASMWFFTINLNVANECVGIDIHRTYFQHNKQTSLIKSLADFDNPKSLDYIIEQLRAVN